MLNVIGPVDITRTYQPYSVSKFFDDFRILHDTLINMGINLYETVAFPSIHSTSSMGIELSEVQLQEPYDFSLYDIVVHIANTVCMLDVINLICG